jgi:methylamine dehydrogenase heavy chain
LLGIVILAGSTGAHGEEYGRVLTLPPVGDHWVLVPDRLLKHSAILDGDTGDVLGMLSGPGSITPKLPLYSPARSEFYTLGIVYSRGTRGERTDFVTVLDAETLAVETDIVLPTRTAESNTSFAYAALLGDRFLVSYNQFPNTSASVTDVSTRAFVGEIAIAGCSGIFAVTDSRFATLCGNGTAVAVDLDASGRQQRLTRTERFFDVVEDPVMIAGARRGTAWLFVSFEGMAHEVELASDPPAARAQWSLVSDGEREDGWRPGGLQPVALHASSNRLYVVMHRGRPGSHKDPGPEIWVFDVAEQRRVARIEAPNLSAAFLGSLLEMEDGFGGWLVRSIVPNAGVHSIAVTQDDAPLLFARSGDVGVVAVLDARSGEHLRNISEVGLTGPTLGVPR